MSAVLPLRPQQQAAWREAFLALGLLLLWLLIWYHQTLFGMVAIWESSQTFAHAFVVPPISLWLIWRRRKVLMASTPRPNAWFLLPIAAFAMVWLMGDLVAVNALTHLAVVAALVLAIPALWGFEASKPILFPLGFLFFAVPFGEFLIPHMMESTADFTILALRLTGIPVYREGLQFVIPSGSWSVVEACSGIRYLIASVMVGTLFGYLNYRTLRKRLIFVGISIAVPLVANWLRAYMIVMLGHLSGNELATGADHLVYGWLFFGVIMTIMFMLGSRWSDPWPEDDAVLPPVRVEAPNRSVHAIWLVTLAGALVIWLPQLTLWSLARYENAGQPSLQDLPVAAPGWHATTGNPVDWTPEFHKPSAALRQTFIKSGQEVGLYIAYYRHQEPLRKLVSSQNMLVKSNNRQWTQMVQGAQVVDLPEQGRLNLSTAELRRAGVSLTDPHQHRLVVWHLYWVNGHWTNSDVWAKAYGAWYRLLGRGDDGASVVFYAEKGAADDTQAALSSFVRENLHLIDAQLRKARGNE